MILLDNWILGTEPKPGRKDLRFKGFLIPTRVDTPKNTPSKRWLLLDVFG
jgi:hypothetical protein